MTISQMNSFPPAWLWLVDEAIPKWVKKSYSPKESWKDKPFTLDDAKFFFKGVEELSELFTDERPKGMPQYFLHPRYRSGYLLYFLPLQAAKFLTLFQMHSKAIESALQFARQEGVLRIADLGAGPGTASLSLLLVLLNQKLAAGEELPPVELHWFDTNLSVMKDGQFLVEELANSFPKLRGKIQLFLNELPWWKAPSKLPKSLALTVMGHILNESTAPQGEVDGFWEEIVLRSKGGGLLLVEPASRRPSQVLSSLRDEFLASGLIENTPARIWGPCLHSGACPMAEGRDWCHFSVPVQIPGKWFRGFSEGLGSERHWLKYSYLWLASEGFQAPVVANHLRRVISDALGRGPRPEVLICEPEVAGRWNVPTYGPAERATVKRGDVISVRPSSPERPVRESRGPLKSREKPKGFKVSEKRPRPKNSR